MSTDLKPWLRVGTVTPHPLNDTLPYEFHLMAPPGVMLMTAGLEIADYTLEAVEAQLPVLDRRVDSLMRRGAQRISLSGVPLAMALGRDRTRSVLGALAAKCKVPADHDLEAPRHNIMTDGLGERWSILENGYKPYPCGFVAHAMIDAVRDLRAKVGPNAKLKRLKLRVSPESTHLMGNPNPTNELEAKFSLLYDAAVAWVEGHVTPAAFEEEAIADPRYRAVMALTEIITSKEVAQDEAFADAEFADGTTASLHVPHARGTLVRQRRQRIGEADHGRRRAGRRTD